MLYEVITAETDTSNAIKQSLARVLPGVTPDQIKPSPMQGVAEVLVGPRVFYISEDGRYLLQGSLIDLETRKDISEERRKDLRLDA